MFTSKIKQNSYLFDMFVLENSTNPSDLIFPRALAVNYVLSRKQNIDFGNQGVFKLDAGWLIWFLTSR